MRLLVKMLTGFSFTVDDLEATDTIHELKGRVYEREGYLPASQRIADGASKSNFDNDVTLEEAGFKDGDTAHLLVALEVLKEDDNQDWRENRSLEQRVKHLLDTGMCSDVLLQVQKPTGEWEDIRAHRTILTQASSVLETLCSPTLKRPHPRIKVTDISSDELWQLLRSIYCGPLNLDVTNVMGLYQAAVTYRLTEIIDKCQAYMSQNLDQFTCGDLLAVFDTLLTKDHNHMAHIIVSHIRANLEQCIFQPQFACLSHRSLARILHSRRKMDGCSEIELYRACVGWARTQCEKDGVEATGPACRHALGDCLHNIQFSAMTSEEFQEVCAGLPLMTDDEKDNVRGRLGSTGEAEQRTEVPPEDCCREDDEAAHQFVRFSEVSTSGWCTNNDETIDFQVDKSIELTAVSTYEALDPLAQCDVRVAVLDIDGIVLAERTSRIPSSGDGVAMIHHVHLSRPVHLKANIRYTLCIRQTCPAVQLLYGEGGRDTVTVAGDPAVTVTVYNSATCVTGTTVKKGQIPGFSYR